MNIEGREGPDVQKLEFVVGGIYHAEGPYHSAQAKPSSADIHFSYLSHDMHLLLGRYVDVQCIQ